MRGLLQSADLDRYAGQFVWLELNFDKGENRAFFDKYGAISTPTFYIIDPRDEHVVVTQAGAMSLAELNQFLDRGTAAVVTKTRSPADAALARGDALLAKKPDNAVQEYREALRVAPASWPNRELVQASLVTALQTAGQYRQCAETAVAEATNMTRTAMFGRTLVGGMWCVVSADEAPWTKQLAGKLEPLAKEALSLRTTVRDHRDELYRTLMYLSLARDDKPQAAAWGDRWLNELDTRNPASDEERSAVDIARVEDIQTFGDPRRILSALLASERAMPTSWNASLRVAQMESAAKNYGQAVAACDRGMTRNPGPAGESWLLRVKADALTQMGKTTEARTALETALRSAEAIPNKRSRDNTIHNIRQALGATSASGRN